MTVLSNFYDDSFCCLVSIMSFLKWREKRKDLTELLKNLCLVSGQEIIKVCEAISLDSKLFFKDYIIPF